MFAKGAVTNYVTRVVARNHYSADEDPYEHVQQTNRGTMDRFRKIMRSTSKVRE